jgi:hypothetical protein
MRNGLFNATPTGAAGSACSSVNLATISPLCPFDILIERSVFEKDGEDWICSAATNPLKDSKNKVTACIRLFFFIAHNET